MSGESKSPSRELDADVDEVPDSQLPETEPQSSCETFMSQQSENEEPSDKQEEKVVEDIKSADASVLNSSLEANTSGENIGSSFAEKTPSLENLQETRKRKGRSDDSTPSPKRLRKGVPVELTLEEEKSPESVLEEHSKKHDMSVMEISSTPEKTIVIDDSQEFSLRIEESSPPTTESNGKNTSHKANGTSPAVSVVNLAVSESPTASVASVSLSQKSVLTWNSHTNEHILSWGSHKDIDDSKLVKEEDGEGAAHLVASDNGSSPDSLIGKHADNAMVKEVIDVVRAETRAGPLAMVIAWVFDNNNKVISAKIKQVSLIEEHPVDKPSRLSSASATSTKSSSSAGSVGLPGPFPLPGKSVYSRLSTVSTVSSATSSSSASTQAWDGPFLKPPVPGSKLNVSFSCTCGEHFPPVDRFTSTSPVINGNPPVTEVIEEEVKALTPKRGRKPQRSLSGSTVSSGPLEEETSSSGSQPQASSTPSKVARRRPKRQQNGTVVRSAKKVSRSEEGGSIPVRTPRSVGRASKSGTSQLAKKIEKGEGEPVMARWGGDGRYYPGWVTDPLTSPQVLVRFCDGQSKPTALSKVVRANIITPGTLVLAATTSGEYEEALVVQVNLSGAEPVYTVERDKTKREVQFPNIALQQATVTELTVSEAQKVAATTNFNDLSLENIIAHPRKRSARTPVEGSNGRKKKRQTTPQPCTSHGQTYNGPDETYGDTDSSTHSTCSLDLRGKEIKPLDVECFPPESTRIKLVYNRGNMAYKKKEGKMSSNSDEQAIKEAGPIPELGSNLFKGCVFLITYTDKVKLLGNEQVSYSSIEDSNGVGLNQSLWRDRLRLQIRNGGGKVYNSFSEVTKEELPNTYLITDKQCNTPLYLQCLVNNIPIYSHSIVIQCCAQNRPWKEMISARGVKRLLAGYSLARCCLVNPRSLTPLRGRTLLLALSGEPSLSTFWQSLITKVGGTVDLHPHGSLEENKYDVVVTDTDCDQELVAEACNLRVPLVSMTWLQQVIITGEWRSPTEHPLYKYNTSGEGESPEY